MSTTEEKTVTVSDIIAEVRKLAEEMPDFVYRPDFENDQVGSANGCSYIYGGCKLYPNCCGCIMGQALRRLGVMVPESKDNVPIYLLLKSIDLREGLTGRTEGWLATVQQEQDRGNAWADCVKAADERCPL